MSTIITFLIGIRGYIILVLIAVAAGLLFGWYEYRQGYADHETFTKLQTAMLDEAARQKEQAWQDQVDDLDKQHYQDYQNAQKTIAQLRADVADGKRRLSVRGKRPVCTPPQATKTAGMDDGTTRAELDGQASQDIIGIVIEGDLAIRQLNALQDRAEIVTK